MSKLLLEQETHRILGTCFEVYKEKGCGFVEPVYQECLEMELAGQSIQFVAQQEIGLSYKGRPLKQTYRADFVCFGKVMVEIKAVSALNDEHPSANHELHAGNRHPCRPAHQLRPLPRRRT